MQEDRAAIQRDLGRLEKWPVRKSMKFGKDKCEKISTSPAPGKEEPSATVQAGDWWAGEQLCRKRRGVMLATSQQCVLEAKETKSIQKPSQ